MDSCNRFHTGIYLLFTANKLVHPKKSESIPVPIVGRATLKMLRRKSKTQFVKQERNTQNTIALLNYLKPIAPQQIMLGTQVFTKNF